MKKKSPATKINSEKKTKQAPPRPRGKNESKKKLSSPDDVYDQNLGKAKRPLSNNGGVAANQPVAKRSDSPYCGSLFVSVDNDIAHHYCAQLSIICRDAAESPHFKRTFSTQLDNVVLLSKEPFFLNAAQSDDIQYPVALELDCKHLANLTCHKVCRQEVSPAEESLSNNISGEFDQVIVSGYIPFSAVRKIHFLNEENQARFFSLPAKNIIFDKSLAQLSPDRFKSAPDIDSSLCDQIKKIPSRGKKIKRLNHIRAALLASVSCFDLNITDNATSSYDKMILDILFPGDSDLFENKYQSLTDKISEVLVEHGSFPIIDSKMGKDQTFLEFKWILDRAMKDSDEELPSFTEGLCPSERIELLMNKYAYRVLAWLLLNEAEYSQIPFVEKYKEALNQHLDHFAQLQGLDRDRLDDQMKIYNSALDKLKQIVKGLSSQKIQSDNNEYATLRAFYGFTLGYSGDDHFVSLSERLRLRQESDKYQIRLVWSLYGLLYGMYCINNQFRQDIHLVMNSIDNRIGLPIPWDESIKVESGQIVKSGEMAAVVSIQQNDQELDRLIQYLEKTDKTFVDEKIAALRSELAARILERHRKR